MIRPLLAAALALAALASAGNASARPDAQTGEALPAESEIFPACSAERTAFCIEQFLVDTGAGTLAPPPAGVDVAASLTQPGTEQEGLSVRLRITSPAAGAAADELSPILPAGTLAHVVVRTGSWAIPGPLFSTADLLSWQRTADPVTGNALVLDFRTGPFTFASNCNYSDGCTSPTDIRSSRSHASFSMSRYPLSVLDGLTPELRGENLRVIGLQEGIAWGGDTHSRGFEFDANGTLTIPVAAPHLNAFGEAHVGSVIVILPDSWIVGEWGADPLALTQSRVLGVTKRSDGSVVALTPTLTRIAGGVRVEIRGITFSAPVLELGAKRLLKRPLSLDVRPGKRRAFVTPSAVPRATSYQAACVRGARTVYAKSRKRAIVVTRLSAGIWTCRARGVAVMGGAFSFSQQVRVRA